MRTFLVLAASVVVSTIGQKLRGASAYKSGCAGGACDHVPDDKFAILLESDGMAVISIGNSEGNQKCVQPSSPYKLTCDADAGNAGKRMNADDSSDQFHVFIQEAKDSKSGRPEVCVKRTDNVKEGWGQYLKIQCHEEKENPGEKCMCLTTAEGACNCKGCTETEQMNTCHELLGPCECQRSDEAICDCSGYCHRPADRQDACENEAGCQWTGQWCEAQIGLLWD